MRQRYCICLRCKRNRCKFCELFAQNEVIDLLQAAHKSPEFRKEWGRFDKLTDDIDPHLYEVVHFESNVTT